MKQLDKFSSYLEISDLILYTPQITKKFIAHSPSFNRR
jgi:hypothetical protein